MYELSLEVTGFDQLTLNLVKHSFLLGKVCWPKESINIYRRFGGVLKRLGSTVVQLTRGMNVLFISALLSFTFPKMLAQNV